MGNRLLFYYNGSYIPVTATTTILKPASTTCSPVITTPPSADSLMPMLTLPPAREFLAAICLHIVCVIQSIELMAADPSACGTF